MSCVVTNRWSDWSTQSWNSNKLALRVHKINDDYVVSDSIVTFLNRTFSDPERLYMTPIPLIVFCYCIIIYC